MKKIIFSLILCTTLSTVCAQYKFKHTKDLECTEVKSQDRTGTCWSFATSSFIESELMRMGHDEVNLSEIFVVRNIYKDKARNYVLRQGKANFSQGSLAHDLINVVAEHGIMPDKDYSGLIGDAEKHDHSEMEAGLKGFLDGVIKQRRVSDKWEEAFDGILDAYLGEVPSEFEWKGDRYSAKKMAKAMNLKADDYINLTSFTHHPFNEEFILEIPDNYSNGAFYNVELEKMMASIDNAVDKGYSVAWDGDVSEKGFDAKEGIAVLPFDSKREDLFQEPGEEMSVTQENRQVAFESYSTTDDHLMHIVGKAKDQKGTTYYIIKNSWGDRGPYEGYIYMSEAYVRMKTVSVMMHKDALIEDVGER
ncbi:MAG: C1 family peptidase [Bacteroidota bacterium]